MENIEDGALATYKRAFPLWLRYVDDTFPAVHKRRNQRFSSFYEHLNRQYANIEFTKIEGNSKILFLDCLVTRNNYKLRATIYRKPTHTDTILDQSSYNPYFSQSNDYTDLDETSATSLSHLTVKRTNLSTYTNVFSKSNIN